MGHYSPESPRDMSPDTMSPTYPNRPIRPLPKRRIRERLSPDVAESIKYPPVPPTTTPLFYYPYGLATEEDRTRERQYPVDRPRAEEIEHNYISRRNVQEVESDEDYTELANRSRYSRHSPDTAGRSYRYVQKPESTKYGKPEPPASTTSSADGYDSFENTNNKKKRKIPTPGDVGLNGIHLSNDLASLGISSASEETLTREDGSNGAAPYGSPLGGNSSQGISGPGRGRYSRAVGNGRSPLRTLSDAPNNYTNGRTPKQRQAPWPTNESTGIISTAIANAEKDSLTPSRGQENVSLLQQASKKSSPASTQFTFTCDSQVPGTIAWPGPPPPPHNPMNQSPAARAINSHGTQTSPKTVNGTGHNLGLSGSQHTPHAAKQNGRPPAPEKKTRKRTGKEYLIAARQRRQAQEYQNYHHPPAPEDEWICEFCEYERIFGTPPEALIRQYEIKDRRIRKQEAERRRLLEKAKMKGRKGKKGTKMAPKNAATIHDRQAQQGSTHNQPHNQAHDQGTSEEYYEDEYDEEYPQNEALPSPTIPHLAAGHDNIPHVSIKHGLVQGGIGTSEALVS